MNPQERSHWQRISSLLDEALDLEESERQALLDRACAGEPEIRREVAALVDAAGRAGGFLEADAVEALSKDSAWDPDAWLDELHPAAAGGSGPRRPEVGALVGPWRIVHLLDRGGMGSVYVAERADGQFQRTVALKLLDREELSRGSVRRFLQEREVLARLEHRNIARLLDGGVLDDGTPWFTMEYVDGASIDRHCDDRHLGIDDRLRLFLQVCDAVQYAHESLVVHRDLKPGNVLVTTEGCVKLLDFGIAKLLDDEARDATRTGIRVMTPRYASPEQFEGGRITTASDVYALGLLLFELLTGRRAHPGRSGDLPEMRRAALELDPPRPSRAVRGSPGISGEDEPGALSPEAVAATRGTTPLLLSHTLLGDLDAVVLKALRKEPERRYPTAAALRLDLEHYLGSLPVEAHRGTRTYRIRKFVRRHRTRVAASLVVLLSLTGGLVAAAAQARIASTQRDRARIAEAATAAINEFLVRDLLTSSSPESSRGKPITVREVLDTAARSVGTAFSGAPAVQASVRQTLSETYESLGDYKSAHVHAQESLDLLRSARGEEDRETLRARVLLARVLADEGAYAEARSTIEDVRRVQERTLGADHLDTIQSAIALGRVLNLVREYAGAERLLRESLATIRALHPDAWRTALDARRWLAESLGAQRKLSEAEEVYRDLLETQRARLGVGHPETLSTLQALGLCLRRQRRLADAEAMIHAVLDARLRLYGEDHPATGDALMALANVDDERNRYDEADALLKRALGVYRRTLGPEHPKTVTALRNLGIMARHDFRLQEAESYYREVYTIRRHTLGDDSAETFDSMTILQGVLADEGRTEEARGFGREVRDFCERAAARAAADRTLIVNCADLLLGENPPDLRDPRRALDLATRATAAFDRKSFDALEVMSRAHAALGERERAIETLREALALPDGLSHSDAERRLVEYIEERGDFEGAERFLHERLDRRRRERPDDHLVGDTLQVLGEFLLARGRLDEARSVFQETIDVLGKTLPWDDWRIGRGKSWLGETLFRRGDLTAAETELLEGYRILAADARISSRYLEDPRNRLVRLYEAWGRPGEAAEWKGPAPTRR